MCSPSGGSGARARLCTAVLNGWLQRVHDRAADALWTVGPARTAAGPRPSAQAPLAAVAPAALRPGGQDRAPPAPGAGEAPRRVRAPGGCSTVLSQIFIWDRLRHDLPP